MARRSWPRNAGQSLPMVITARMAYSSVLLLLLLVNTSTALFFQRRQLTSCVSGMPDARLTRLTTGMNTSNVFDNLLPRILIPRVSGTQGNVAVRQFISREMQSLGWVVQEDAFASNTPYGYKNFTNVIATLNPYATKRIVVACHFDSKYYPAYRGHSFLGATDSAVPCSVMMDTARKLTDFFASANSNMATLQFLFFDGEEAFQRWTSTDSLYGSRHLASKWQGETDPNDPTASNNLENIMYFILLDLIGTSDTHIVNHFQNTSHLFQRLHNIETCLKSRRLLNRLTGRPLFDRLGSSYAVEDDHVPFMQRGVPILHLISTPFPRVWHTMSDNLASLSVAAIDDFSRIFRLFITSALQEASTAV